MTTSRARRVVQWTTGNVGRRSVIAICANPEFALVGCYAWSRDRVGRDVGELCSLDEPLGPCRSASICCSPQSPGCCWPARWPHYESGSYVTA